MKRLFSIILSVAVASVFTACKDDYDGWLPDNPDKPHTTETISTKKTSTTTSTSGRLISISVTQDSIPSTLI